LIIIVDSLDAQRIDKVKIIKKGKEK